jgi:hypothetical protein
MDRCINGVRIGSAEGARALARAILSAAQEEHPDRRLTLSRGERVIAESG